MNILVIRLSSMGDVILAAAVFELLREHHPTAHIDLVTGALYTPLFTTDPRLHRVVPYDRADPAPALQACARGEYHWVIDLQRNRRSAHLVTQARAARVSRFHKHRFRRQLLLWFGLDRFDPSATVVARYLQAAGWSAEGPVRHFPRVVSDAPIQPPHGALLSNRPRLALLPFSAWQNKTWPLESFAAVGQAFIDKGWQVLILGGPNDRDDAERLQHTLGPSSLSIAGRVPLDQSAAILHTCRLAIGNDTGLTHLARAVGVRTVALFGSTTRHFGFFPFGPPPFRILEASSLDCRPCHAHGGNRCRHGGRPCLTTIEPAAAIAALETLDTDNNSHTTET